MYDILAIIIENLNTLEVRHLYYNELIMGDCVLYGFIIYFKYRNDNDSKLLHSLFY